MLFQTVLTLNDFYSKTTQPRFLLLVAPAAIAIIALFSTSKGRSFLDQMNLPDLTILHTIRIPVELVLYYLFVVKAIPEIMTFEGRNLDIIAGITAPIVYYFGFKSNKIPAWGLIFWNILCIGLLINIIVIAILSTKTPFQQFGFDQPNIAVTYFPFSWLPSVVVPLVLLSHLVSIRQLIKGYVSSKTTLI
jgi:hypothetical protein